MPSYPDSKSNQDIVRWLTLQLQDLLPLLPRPRQERGVLGSLRGMSRSLDRQDQRRRESGEIFISYRSKHSSKVERLRKQIERGEFHGGQPRMVRCFPPGALSEELMTEQRRWQILSMLDRFIGPASEIWIYETSVSSGITYGLGALTQ